MIPGGRRSLTSARRSVVVAASCRRSRAVTPLGHSRHIYAISFGACLSHIMRRAGETPHDIPAPCLSRFKLARRAVWIDATGRHRMAMTHIFLIRAAFVEAWHVRRGQIRKRVVQKRGARRHGPRKSNLHQARLRQVFARVRLTLNRVGLIWIEVCRCFADARPVRTCWVNVADLVLAHRLAATASSVAVQPPVRRQVGFA